MSLSLDLDLIVDVVKRTDPSFASVDPKIIEPHIQDARRATSQTAKDQFLLSAMRLLALSGNGHTRLIPNDAISVLPLRFVSIGKSVFLTKTSSSLMEFAPSKLIAVNGTSVEKIERARPVLLAGTRQRQRVIGALLFAWPAALAHLGFGAIGQETEYHLHRADGRMSKVRVPSADTVKASGIYPRNEHGQVDPVWDYNGFVEIHDCSKTGFAITLPSFFDPEERAFPQAINEAVNSVQSRPGRFLVIDVRGNTGGDFLATLPLINAIAESAKTCGCAVLVDKFTFSAAIVFVAILRFRLGPKLKVIGEDMGDGLKFFAEGGLIELPTSGAVVRHSSARHDWETGIADPTTPPEIAQQLVPVRKLDVDQQWVTTPFDTAQRNDVYSRLIDELA